MNQDLREKRGQYIDRCMTLNQEFFFASPEVKLRMSRLYNSHFSGSNNWMFDSDLFGQLCRSYNVNLRAIFDLPHGTHSWIVEQLSGGHHAKQLIYSRYVKFVSSLQHNKRTMVQDLFNLLKNNARSTVGSILRTILIDADVFQWFLESPQNQFFRV